MTMIPMLLNITEKRVVSVLQEAAEKLDNTNCEVVLDFSSVRRIDSSALRAIEAFVDTADAKGVKVVLCGMSVGVYKVLKLAKLAPRFSFPSEERSPSS